MSTDRHWSLTLNSDVLRSMIADAWAEIPDDMAGDYDALGDAITALVEQRDAAREARDNWEASATRLAAERDADLARFAAAPPTFTVAQQWRDARQLLNDAGYSELTLPAAVASLLPPPADEDELAASIARHPSSRRKPEQPADPTPAPWWATPRVLP